MDILRNCGMKSGNPTGQIIVAGPGGGAGEQGQDRGRALHHSSQGCRPRYVCREEEKIGFVTSLDLSKSLKQVK